MNLPEAGQRVGFVFGPGEFPEDYPGLVLKQVTDRWGTHAVVEMNDGTYRTVHSLTTVGIGCYLLSEPRP